MNSFMLVAASAICTGLILSLINLLLNLAKRKKPYDGSLIIDEVKDCYSVCIKTSDEELYSKRTITLAVYIKKKSS